jgi:hypothetical protein
MEDARADSRSMHFPTPDMKGELGMTRVLCVIILTPLPVLRLHRSIQTCTWNIHGTFLSGARPRATSWQNPQNAVTRSDGNQYGNKLLPGTPTSQMHCVIAERNAPCDLAQAASAIHRPHSVLHALHRHSGSTPFQRPQAHPARRDPRRHNEQKLTVPDPQAACMRHRPNFGKRKPLACATDPTLESASSSLPR